MKRIIYSNLGVLILSFCMLFLGANSLFSQKWMKEKPKTLYAVPQAFQGNDDDDDETENIIINKNNNPFPQLLDDDEEPNIPLTDMKVGIGVADPQATLHVKGNTIVDGTLQVNTISVEQTLAVDEIIVNKI